MSETFWLALIGIVGTLTGAIVPSLLQHRSEERRWLAEFYLKEEITAIKELIASMTQGTETLLIVSSLPTVDQLPHLTTLLQNLTRQEKAAALARTYLPLSVQKQVNNFTSAFGVTSQAITYQHTTDPDLLDPKLIADKLGLPLREVGPFIPTAEQRSNALKNLTDIYRPTLDAVTKCLHPPILDSILRK